MVKMAVYTYELSTEHNFPGISIYKKLEDGVHYAWEVRANEGYVFYNVNANDTEWNEDLQEEVPVTYYYIIKSLPLNFNFANFPWVAVPRDSVDENYIFGGGDNNDHEVM